MTQFQVKLHYFPGVSVEKREFSFRKVGVLAEFRTEHVSNVYKRR